MSMSLTTWKRVISNALKLAQTIELDPNPSDVNELHRQLRAFVRAEAVSLGWSGGEETIISMEEEVFKKFKEKPVLKPAPVQVAEEQMVHTVRNQPSAPIADSEYIKPLPKEEEEYVPPKRGPNGRFLPRDPEAPKKPKVRSASIKHDENGNPYREVIVEVIKEVPCIIEKEKIVQVEKIIEKEVIKEVEKIVFKDPPPDTSAFEAPSAYIPMANTSASEAQRFIRNMHEEMTGMHGEGIHMMSCMIRDLSAQSVILGRALNSRDMVTAASVLLEEDQKIREAFEKIKAAYTKIHRRANQ